MSVQTSPCTWPVSYAGCSDGLPPEPLASMPASGIFEQMAIDYLWRWTGKSLGVCEITIQPCRQDCADGLSTFNGSGPFRSPYPGVSGGSPWTPVIVNGLWYNIGCGRCGDRCGCGGEAPLRIPGPIDSVVSITEDGETLDPAVYYVDNLTELRRTDGHPWAACGLEITYNLGTPVPDGGQVAAGVLARELAKAACRDNTCQLPTRIQTLTRQGVTIAMLDSFDDIDRGHTGIWIIDSWISSMTQPAPGARVLSPDLPRNSARRQTWP